MNKSTDPNFFSIFRKRPQAMAIIRGSEYYPEIEGEAYFWQTNYGVIAAISARGLPKADGVCSSPIHAVHIHNGASCTGNQTDLFANVGTHFDPYTCPHPYHAGDMPPLFASNGYAFSVFLSDRFIIDQLIGKTLVIHSAPDDFTSQPAGNSGIKIACGEIY